jgi:ribulose-5-phosphate 4-epimerase/fuculose-1-phosphate aldolase
MRGHGYTVAARSIGECVFRAIYTRENAAIQTASLGLSAAYRGAGDSPTEIQYLGDDEIEGATGIALTGWARTGGLWVREVEAANLYASSG